ncbi:MAG: peptidoglycan D,D-transpeptidase FtsI family protein [Coprococcus sp.]
MLCAGIFLSGRLAYLMIYKARHYSALADSLHERERSIKAPRGRIYDRNGNILADNRAVCSISVVHSQIEDEEQVIEVLLSYLDIDEEKIRKKVTKVSSREIIAVNVEKSVADEIRKLNISGIKVDEDYKRYYPYGSLASKVLGFTGADNQGIVGLEVSYDDILSGTAGSINAVTDAKGIELVEFSESRVNPIPGDDLITSIDLNIQRYATQSALKVKEEKNANRVCIIIMNPQNGEIYAMADVPEYDLNNPFELNYEADVTADNQMDLLNNMWRNFNISDTYEPGSTCKIITLTAALETGAVTKENTFFCPGYKIVEDRRIRCHKTTGHGSEDLVHALMNSCNPAFMEIGERTGADALYEYYGKLGLFDKTGIDLPGEGSSIMHNIEDVGPVELATMSFGQSFQITPIQFITAISTVINGGNKITPHIGKMVIDSESNEEIQLSYPVAENAIKTETSETVREMLEKVVSEGSGNKAAIQGYRIGGKTATSEKLPRGTGRYISSFIGFAPADNPQVIAIILIDEPEGTYYGGTIAAPVIKEVFENILPYLGIEKDPALEISTEESVE